MSSERFPDVFGFSPGGRVRVRLLRQGEAIHLGPKALELLELLLRNRPNALSKGAIRDGLWPRTFVSDSNVATVVGELRQALGDSARRPRYVRTVHGLGYAFCGTAEEESPGRGSGRKEGTRFRLHGEQGEIPLSEGENILGRVDEAVAWIDSPMVSRRHARIVVRGDEAILEDLGSRNGTSLNGKRIESATALADHDQVTIGRVVFTVRVLRGAASTRSEIQE
jgi:DNA-binding winged helix-turn-helix (wHTH) protein